MAYQTTATPGNGYGNDYIDSLIGGCQWTSSGTVAQGTTASPIDITYSFGLSSNWYDYPASWFQSEKAAFQQALQYYSNVCNITFTETAYTSNYYAQSNMVFYLVSSNHWGNSNTLGEFQFPNGSNPSIYGFFNYSASSWGNLTPGSNGFVTIIHELGHGLGLAHPHDGGLETTATLFPGVSRPSSLGTYSLNQGIWTVMSYNSGWNTAPSNTNNYGWESTLMAFDIAALQIIYGANTNYAAGNNVYSLPSQNAVGTGWSCIWDAGGVDVITNAGSSIGCTINLQAAPLTGANAGGYVSYAPGIIGGFTIANNVTIENAIGGSGNDTLVGNTAANALTGGAGNDILTGGAGNDTLNGGSGVDIAVFSGNRSNYTITYANGVYTVTGTDGVDTLTDIERLQFADITINAPVVVSLASATWSTNEGNSGTTNLTITVTLDRAYATNQAVNYAVTGSGSYAVNGADFVGSVLPSGTITFTAGSTSQVITIPISADVLSEQDETFTLSLSSPSSGLLLGLSIGTGTIINDDSILLTDNNDTWTGTSADENVFGLGGNDTLNAGAGNDILTGGAGNDTLNGGDGDDILIGGIGNDIMTGGAGIDTASYADASGGVNVSLLVTKAQLISGLGSDTISQVENLIGSSFNDVLTGNALANSISGGAGNDVIVLSATAHFASGEIISGGEGIDELRVADTKAGTLTLSSDITGIELITIGTGTGGVGSAALTGAAAINVNASMMSDAITLMGNGGANVLTGGSGDDYLYGNGGNDTLIGGDGYDCLLGGLGADVLTGGAGADAFIFNTAIAKNIDRVTDFSRIDGDAIFLSQSIFGTLAVGNLNFDAFWTGTAAHDVTDRIIYNSTTGALFYDADGTGKTQAVQIATLSTALNLSSYDFYVY